MNNYQSLNDKIISQITIKQNIKEMNPAKRLYGKRQLNKTQPKPQISSFFRSKVQRKINQQPDNQLGPGQYQISLPLVKPTFQTILKNDNTVIVKFNNHFSSAFHSKSPRFNYDDIKQYKNIRSFSYRYNRNSNYQNQNPQTDRDSKEVKDLSKTLLISEMNQNSTLQQNYHLNRNKSIKRNYSMKRRKSKKSIYINSLSTKQQTIPNQKTIDNKKEYRTLPPASRLHNLQPNLIQTKLLNSNRYNSSIKSTQWSKYKLKRRSFVQQGILQQLPGPGTYLLRQPKYKTYNDRAEITSWQFNSKTSRSHFQQITLKQQLKQKYLNKDKNYNFQQIYKQNDNQKQIKKKILNKKISKQRINNFHKSKISMLTSTLLQPNFSLQFKAIHSRQNLFIDVQQQDQC